MGDNTLENSLLEESIVAEPTETNEEDKENDNAEDASRNYGLQVPLSRIKKIMKTDPELHLASQDAVFLVAKATVSGLLKYGYWLVVIKQKVITSYSLISIYCYMY